MSQTSSAPEFVCNTCGAPIKTNAEPGTVLKCDCCGALFVVPEPTVSKQSQSD